MALIGIDLGTTNSLVCTYKNGEIIHIPNHFSEYMTPSAVYYDNNKIIVGKYAKQYKMFYPDNTATSFKLLMGSDKEILLGDKTFTPEELSAFVIQTLVNDAQNYLNEQIDEAVISVPAYFDDNKRCATKRAAELAGIKVERLINEPSAAALYYQIYNHKKDGCIMIIDMGGGTLDVSIVDCFENIIEIIGISGDNNLGGNDFSDIIVNEFCKQHKISELISNDEKSILFSQAEELKQLITKQETVKIELKRKNDILTSKFSRSDIFEICKPVLERVELVIRNAIKNCMRKVKVQDVVLVGGSAKFVILQDFLTQLFSKTPTIPENPDFLVSSGLGVYLGIKSRAEQLQDIVMTDVCPFSLGIASYTRYNLQIPHMEIIIPRNSMLPCAHTRKFYTSVDGQEILNFEIFEGEEYYTAKNKKLGQIEISVPPDKAGYQWGLVTFSYDINGILSVSVKSSSGDCNNKIILNPNINLSEKDLERAKENQKKLLYQPDIDLQTYSLLNELVSLYPHAGINEKERIIYLISYYESTFEPDSLIIQKRQQLFIQDEIEQIKDIIYNKPNYLDFWQDEEE